MYLTDRNGLKIYYEIHGQGETVVLLHHGFGAAEMWKEIYPALLPDYRVVVYDRRGYGRSEMGSDFREFYLHRYRPESVEELEQLRQELNVDAFHIVGQCEGGVVGVDFAVRYPQFVKSLVISSTLCHGHRTMEDLNVSYFPDESVRILLAHVWVHSLFYYNHLFRVEMISDRIWAVSKCPVSYRLSCHASLAPSAS